MNEAKRLAEPIGRGVDESDGAGWARRQLGQIASLRTEKVIPSRDDRRPYVALEHIAAGGSLVGHAEARDSISHKTVFRAGDTLFGKLRPNLRKVTRVPFDGVCSTDILAIFPEDPTDPSFLAHLLGSGAAHAHAMHEITGTKMPRTSWDHLQNFEFPLPPLPEQRAIAAVLDAIDAAIEHTEAVIAATEKLRKSLLRELLTRGVPGWHTEWKHSPGIGTIPADWEVGRLGNAIIELRYGTSVPLSTTHGAYRILRIPNIARGAVDISEVKYADLPTHEAAVLPLRDGDVLLVRTNGNPELCGQSAVAEGLGPGWAFASYLLRLRTKPETIEPLYLWMYLRSPSGRRQLRGNIRTSAGNYNLSAEGLMDLLLPLPSPEEQRRIVDFARAQADVLRDLRSESDGLRELKTSAADALLAGRMRAWEPGPTNQKEVSL